MHARDKDLAMLSDRSTDRFIHSSANRVKDVRKLPSDVQGVKVEEPELDNS
jgi:hypothetical protein